MDNIRSRKWQITINNPLDHGFTRDKIKKILERKKVQYYCISDEIGEQGTPHVHIYVVWENDCEFNTLIKKFNKKAHVEYPNGTSQENRDYVFKEGKYLNSEKAATNLRDTHEEYGVCPIESPGKRNDLDQLYEKIREGKSNYEIITEDHSMIRYLDKMDKVRKTILSENAKNNWRDIDVTYIWGVTGSGKTRSIMEKYGYANVYRVTDYNHPFDSYQGQDIVLFEEFRSSLRIDDMLKYLDGYPVELACRYSNQQALFTKVYFATNIDITDQYPNIQKDETETWKAFLRRVDNIREYTANQEYHTMKTQDYLEYKQSITYQDTEESYLQSIIQETIYQQERIDWTDI